MTIDGKALHIPHFTAKGTLSRPPMTTFTHGLRRALAMAHMVRRFATRDHDAFVEPTDPTPGESAFRHPRLLAHVEAMLDEPAIPPFPDPDPRDS